jgi:hypothetical protein
MHYLTEGRDQDDGQSLKKEPKIIRLYVVSADGSRGKEGCRDGSAECVTMELVFRHHTNNKSSKKKLHCNPFPVS